jgi:DGQHR domain-containing protein
MPRKHREEGRLAYSTSPVYQGNHTFYTLSIPSDVLARTSFVSRRRDDADRGFQRFLDPKRAEEIARYIDTGGTIPNAIVLSAQAEAQVKILTRKTLEFNDIPRAFLILDGQHRVFGFEKATLILRIPVVVYVGLSLEEETNIFIDINTKQRPVPNELLLDIRKQAGTEKKPEQYLREIFDHFNNQPDSPLFGLLSPAEKATKKISRVTFNGALKPLLPIFENRTAFEVYEPLAAYLSAFILGLENLKVRDSITNPSVIRAIFGIFAKIAERMRLQNKAYEPDQFFSVLEPLFQQSSRPLFSKPGKPSELVKKFEKLLTTQFRL